MDMEHWSTWWEHVTMWLLLSAISAAAAVTGLPNPLLAATSRGHWSWCQAHSQYTSGRYVLVVIFCSGEFSHISTVYHNTMVPPTADCPGYWRSWVMSRSGNSSILVLLVSDEEPSLPQAQDSQHSTPSTQTLIRDVVQPPALTSQQLLSHCQKTSSIFSSTTNSSPLQLHEGLWVEETSPGYELLRCLQCGERG